MLTVELHLRSVPLALRTTILSSSPAPPSPRPAPTSGEDEGTVTSHFIISEACTCVGPSSPDIARLGLPASQTFTPTPFIPGLLWNTTTK
ncbi:hypothetical protein D9756_010596 [Leucocoprinus leucothites]|uniref:Uncharacterized protein n=1 Tax=Leucocoprinus leucothites TaxID=201217 RepID=A0A8H5CS35_9AGAR|nr:hypothetical protein D9756_010596 [Leucoagaricus leucothites]